MFPYNFFLMSFDLILTAQLLKRYTSLSLENYRLLAYSEDLFSHYLNYILYLQVTHHGISILEGGKDIRYDIVSRYTRRDKLAELRERFC